eukprot:1161883-Pelagomonas_calceolata.AAC.4
MPCNRQVFRVDYNLLSIEWPTTSTHSVFSCLDVCRAHDYDTHWPTTTTPTVLFLLTVCSAYDYGTHFYFF